MCVLLSLKTIRRPVDPPASGSFPSVLTVPSQESFPMQRSHCFPAGPSRSEANVRASPSSSCWS